MKKDLILYPDNINENRAKILYKEFRHAWNETPNKEKLIWSKDCAVLFGKVTIRRVKGFLGVAKDVAKEAVKGTSNFAVAVKEKRTLEHLSNQKDKLIIGIKNIYKISSTILKNIVYLLKNNPRESAPIIFLGVLGFFCGAGTNTALNYKDAKTWYDIDGGIPDWDWNIGSFTDIDLLRHRSIFTHSIISAALVETMVFSTVRAANITYRYLPEEHDSFWNNIDKFGDWGHAFASGACTGIAYHLLIDGTIDGGGTYSGLPSMPQWSHQAIAISNAGMEAFDLDKKKQKVTCSNCNTVYNVPNMGAGTKILVNCKSCSKKFEAELI